MVKGALSVIAVLSAIFLAVSNVFCGDDVVLDRRDGYVLVTRGNDLYIETEDGGSSRRMTHTPDEPEISASFGKEGGYIRYLDSGYEAHIISFDSSDASKDNLAIQEQIVYGN